MNLYITSDKIGTPTGGGAVTFHESEALKELGECYILHHDTFSQPSTSVWNNDVSARSIVMFRSGEQLRLAHLYSGTFPDTVHELKNRNCKVVYTIAAHDKEISRREHEALGIPFAYPHLTDPNLWNKYIDGYRHADVIVCPGEVPANTVRCYGPDFANKRIEIIPHGCDIPEFPITPLPSRFTVGYLGAIGPDKGLKYLFEAWKKLNYVDATLVIAGRDSTHPFTRRLWNHFGGGYVHFAGWQNNVSDFYNSISLYVQPSATEGFGIEVLEALAHGRPALCSKAAGAECLLPSECKFDPWNSDAIAERIDDFRKKTLGEWSEPAREMARVYSWDNIRKRYQNLWRELLP